MKTITHCLVALSLASPALSGADAEQELKAAVSAAAKRLTEQPGYGWRTTVQGAGGGRPVGNTSTTGQVEKDGSIWVSPGSPGAFEFARRADKVAVALDGNWMTVEQAAERSPRGRGGPLGGGGLDPGSAAKFKMPLAEVEELLGKAGDFKQSGEAVTAELDADTVSELLGSAGRFGGRRGRGGGPGGPGAALKDARGILAFKIEEGLLTGCSLVLSGTRELGGNEAKLSRTITTAFTTATDSSAPSRLPEDAREILDALEAGRTPNVFVPEPGFQKLFNGHDLDGWSGRPGFWSVEDGAITGRTTQENPARGNHFLIARAGDKNERSRIVDDFELRFSYRIVANNGSGFANSGMQYRSKDLGD